jgi:putative ABC transport system permease protein
LRMARISAAVPRRAWWPPALTLARWRLGSVWRALVGAAFGVVLAVALVCAVPLFAQVTTSAGLRDALRADPFGSSITVSAQTNALSTALANQAHGTLASIVQHEMGGYLGGAEQFTVTTPSFAINGLRGGTLPANANLRLVGDDLTTASAHLRMVSGALPATTGEVSVLVNAATAQVLNLHAGARFVLALPLASGATQSLTVRVAGIFDQLDPQDAYWQNQDFDPEIGGGNGAFFTALAPSATLLAAASNASFSQPASLTWSYPLDLAQLSGNNLNIIAQKFSTTQVESIDALDAITGVTSVDVESGVTALAAYQVRSSALQTPVALFLVQVVALAIFFVSLMADLIVERQAGAIAVLRSRGASRAQIVGALAVPGVVLAVVALILGPLVAIVGARWLAQATLPATDQGAMNVIGGSPLAVALGIWPYIFGAVVVALAAMLLATQRAAQADILALRRESARTARPPAWQRLNLDLLAALIGVTGFVAYTLVAPRLSAATQSALAPLALIAPLGALIATVLLALRVFPTLVQLAARLVARGRGAAPMLALAQMARAPKQGLRMILLLALAVAFTIFALVFGATQDQHTRDAAAFSVGTDFSGSLPADVVNGVTLAQATAQYQQIVGVTSACLGYRASTQVNSQADLNDVSILALDGSTFPQTAIWTPQDSMQSPAALMQQLTAARASAAAQNAVPVIADDALWQGFHLDQNPHFALDVPQLTGGSLHFIAIAHVAHIPSISDAADQHDTGGLLADYQSYATAMQNATGAPFAPNLVWLRTKDDAASLASVRAALTNGALRLNQVQDRRAVLAAAQTDPLRIDLIGVLGIGAATAIVLGVLGALSAAWLNARARQTGFAVLRALGSAPRQIAATLVWEQGTVYAVALALGVGLGAVLAVAVLPALVYTSLATTPDATPLLANVPPIQIAVPVAPLLALLGGLALLCAAALALMTSVATRPAISRTLRVNED